MEIADPTHRGLGWCSRICISPKPPRQGAGRGAAGVDGIENHWNWNWNTIGIGIKDAFLSPTFPEE